MKTFRITICLVLTVVFAASAKKDKPVSMLGKEVPDFSLISNTGKVISLNSYRNARGFIIIFTCNHCPFAKLYTQRLNMLYKRYKKSGVLLLAINPMDSMVYEEETYKGMQHWALTQHYSFPYLQDASQQVAKTFHASHTPQAFVIWKTGDKWIVKYSGAIDDNGQHPEDAKPYVADAVDALLHTKEPTVPETISLGCGINYRN